jgi:hypothetical protein
MRLRAALRHAAFLLGVRLDATSLLWGWEGKSLSAPTKDNMWLRLASAPADVWERRDRQGSEDAMRVISDAVPRPRLHRVTNWVQADHGYRAELYERIEQQPLSQGPMLDKSPELAPDWWDQLRGALTSLSMVHTTRVAIRQERLDWALPKFLEVPGIDTKAPAWSTAHADIQWSNLAGPELCILDWERWGMAPTGYDEASLYIASLTMPEVAEQVRQIFGPVLESPAGRYSQLVVASEYLQGMQRGNNLELEVPLRHLVAGLLG